jgi:56kDa selenium binding protein (SBP56)
MTTSHDHDHTAHNDEHVGHHTDPTFYRSPRDAAAAPAEKLAYVATFSRPADKPDGLAVVDVDPDSGPDCAHPGSTCSTPRRLRPRHRSPRCSAPRN